MVDQSGIGVCVWGMGIGVHTIGIVTGQTKGLGDRTVIG
jgi:hypothetical protein